MAALSLVLNFPNGNVESITAKSTETGLTLASLLLPLKSLYSLSDKARIEKHDGSVLDTALTLKEQGLCNGSSLFFREPEITFAKRTHENSVISLEDFLQSQHEDIPEDPLSCPRDDRECRARDLKDHANSALKAGNFHAALQGYTLAISWLPPEDSDEQLAAALFNNRALVHLKLRDWANARDDADQAFKLSPDNVKAIYRRGLAEKELGERDDALASFRIVVKRDPQDRTARAALTSLQAEIAALAATHRHVEMEIPDAIQWRMGEMLKGHMRPQLVRDWQQINLTDSHAEVDSSQRLNETVANGVRHMFRCQPGLEAFFHECLAEMTQKATMSEEGKPHALVLGAGRGVAVSLCARSVIHDTVASVVVIEPSALLAEHCREVVASFANHVNLENVAVLKSTGQLDNEFVFPQEAFENPAGELGASSKSVLLVCDRICEDLIGERLIPTFVGALRAGRRMLPDGAKVHCIPSRAELICAPLELRSTKIAGCDISKINAMRFTASEIRRKRVPIGARPWKCHACGWLNHPKTKVSCEQCKVEKSGPGLLHFGELERESRGWWPISLDDQIQAEVRQLCASEQVVHEFDFDSGENFSQQCRVENKSLHFKAICNGKVNGMAVWWRLQGPGGRSFSTRPYFAGPGSEGQHASSLQQAVYYFGFEIGVTKGESLHFNVQFTEDHSRVKFDLVSPKLTERMGLVKVEVPVIDFRTVQLLEKNLDLSTNRLLAPIPELDLACGDKLLQFGPFDLVPGAFEPHLWRKLEDRIKLHSERPRPGDKPMVCVFRRGAFEGTVRWPIPSMTNEAVVPRLPSYFKLMSDAHSGPYIAALRKTLSRCSVDRARVLEIGCGPVPLFAMCAARSGARAWAVEMVSELRDLALESVRDNGLEMVFKYKGYSNYSFFGSPKKPEDASVRVMKAMPSTSLQVGVTPKLLDGKRAHVIISPPDFGPLGEDYLLTMWHAAEELLEDGGAIVPSSLRIKVIPVEIFPIACDTNSLLYSHACAGFTVQLSPSDTVKPLCKSAQVLLDIDLRSRVPSLPSLNTEITIENAGTLTGVAFWHEPVLEDQKDYSDDVFPNAMVHLLHAPRKVFASDKLKVAVSFENHCLQLVEVAD